MNNFQRKITDLYIYTIDFDVMLDFIKTPANLQVVGQSVGVSVTCTSMLFFFFFHQTGFSSLRKGFDHVKITSTAAVAVF